MAVKRKRQKKLKMIELENKAVKIRCCYCTLKDKCNRRLPKEQYERLGITTFCSITPERPRSFIKKQRVKL